MHKVFAVKLNPFLCYSRDMIKIKEWKDQEYIVKSIETGRMRMPDTGEDKEVMTSVVIEHKGNIQFHEMFPWRLLLMLLFQVQL